VGYVELHCHSAYSFLDGASQPEELAARAARDLISSFLFVIRALAFREKSNN